MANGLYPKQNDNININNKNSNNQVSGKPSPFLKQDPTTPSPSPETLEKEQRAVSVVIPSPSQQLKEEIQNAEWTVNDSKLMGLSQRFYPTDAYEKRARKGAYPPAKGRANRRNVSLDIGQPKPILAEKPTVHQQLYRSFMRKLKNINGPPVTLARGDEPMLSGFAANFQFVNEYKIREGVSRVPESFNAGCGCSSVCNPARCSCLSKEVDSDDNIIPYQGAPDDPALLVLTPDFLNRTSMIFECSSRCGCNGRCWNDVVQRGRTVRLEIFHTGDRGFGTSPTYIYQTRCTVLTKSCRPPLPRPHPRRPIHRLLPRRSNHQENSRRPRRPRRLPPRPLLPLRPGFPHRRRRHLRRGRAEIRLSHAFHEPLV